LNKFFPNTINRKIFRKFNIFFVPTSLKHIPINYYPIKTTLIDQDNLVAQFQKKKKLIHQTTFKNIHIILYKLFKKKPFIFFDVGGENIDLYLFLNLKLKIKQYYLTNFPLLISIFKTLKKKFKLNNFFPISKINSTISYDFVYFGSCVQYFRDYKNYLKKIFKKNPTYILISGTSFYFDQINKDQIVVKQTNILPNLVFLYFINYYTFIKFMKKNKYSLTLMKKNNSISINYKNFNPYLKKILYLDLMFKKDK
jgi:hypothetical protein